MAHARGISSWMTALVSSAFLALASPLAAQAAPPQTINYQGYVTTATGNPLTGSINVTFRLYDVASGGTELWAETRNGTPVANGLFNVVLGTVTPLTLSFDAQYYLGITVGADAEMTPRQPLASSPYALRANTANSAATAATATFATTAGNADEANVSNSTRGFSANALNTIDNRIAAQTVRAPDRGSAISTVLSVPTTSGIAFNGGATPASLTTIVGMDDVTFVAYVGDGNHLSTFKCADAKCSTRASADSSQETNVSAGLPGTQLAMVLSPQGYPVIGYRKSDGFYTMWCDDDDCSSVLSSRKKFVAAGDSMAMAMGADGLLYIAVTSAGQRVTLVRRPAPPQSIGGTWNDVSSNLLPPEVLGSPGGIGLAVAPDGKLHIAAATDIDPFVLRQCSNATCDAVTAAPPNQLVIPTSIAMYISASGRPVALVSHRLGINIDPFQQDLYSISCANPACTANTVNLLREHAAYPSVALGGDGLPVVAYTNATAAGNQTSLQVAKCADGLCEGLGLPITVDNSTTSVGWFPSIVIANDGNPLVLSFSNNIPKALRSAKCANSFCANNFRRR